MPNEILDQVFSYLAQDKTSALRVAGRVCRRFRAIIKSSSYFHSCVPRKIRSQQLYHAESIHPSLFPKHFLPCYSCNKVYDSRSFEFDFADHEIHNGRGLGGIRAKSRMCLDCHHRSSTTVGGPLPGFRLRDQRRRPLVFGHRYERCIICANHVVRFGEPEDSTGCDKHVDWRAKVLHQRRMKVKAEPWKRLKLLKERFERSRGKRDLESIKFKTFLEKKQARLYRRQHPTPVSSVEEILEDVSHVYYHLVSIPACLPLCMLFRKPVSNSNQYANF